jgi:hypothetical protein
MNSILSELERFQKELQLNPEKNTLDTLSKKLILLNLPLYYFEEYRSLFPNDSNEDIPKFKNILQRYTWIPELRKKNSQVKYNSLTNEFWKLFLLQFSFSHDWKKDLENSLKVKDNSKYRILISFVKKLDEISLSLDLDTKIRLFILILFVKHRDIMNSLDFILEFWLKDYNQEEIMNIVMLLDDYYYNMESNDPNTKESDDEEEDENEEIGRNFYFDFSLKSYCNEITNVLRNSIFNSNINIEIQNDSKEKAPYPLDLPDTPKEILDTFPKYIPNGIKDEDKTWVLLFNNEDNELECNNDQPNNNYIFKLIHNQFNEMFSMRVIDLYKIVLLVIYFPEINEKAFLHLMHAKNHNEKFIKKIYEKFQQKKVELKNDILKHILETEMGMQDWNNIVDIINYKKIQEDITRYLALKYKDKINFALNKLDSLKEDTKHLKHKMIRKIKTFHLKHKLKNIVNKMSPSNLISELSFKEDDDDDDSDSDEENYERKKKTDNQYSSDEEIIPDQNSENNFALMSIVLTSVYKFHFQLRNCLSKAIYSTLGIKRLFRLLLLMNFPNWDILYINEFSFKHNSKDVFKEYLKERNDSYSKEVVMFYSKISNKDNNVCKVPIHQKLFYYYLISSLDD